MARPGTRSSSASNVARIVATLVLAIRRNSAWRLSRSTSKRSAPSAFTTMMPSKLSCTIVVRSPS